MLLRPSWAAAPLTSHLAEARGALTTGVPISDPRRESSSRALRLGLAVLTVALTAAACGARAGSLGAPPSRQADPSGGCERLDSQLLQLVSAADPARFASSAKLDLNQSGVRVVIEVMPGAQPPGGHRIIVEASYANLTQARVPLSELCAVAREGTVIAVRPPGIGLPDVGKP